MKPENKAEVKTPQEFYTEKAVYHVDGYEYNVDEPELVKAFHLFAEQQIGVYKSDLVKRIEDERQMRPYTDDLQSAYDSGWKRLKQSNSALQRFRIEDAASAIDEANKLREKIKQLESERDQNRELKEALRDLSTRSARAKEILRQSIGDNSWNMLDTTRAEALLNKYPEQSLQNQTTKV